jgi:hypothetical protein
MGVKKVEDLIAFQQARAFKLEVYSIVRRHPAAYRDYRYRDQLFDAALSAEANIAEGWRRFGSSGTPWVPSRKRRSGFLRSKPRLLRPVNLQERAEACGAIQLRHRRPYSEP